MKAKLMTAVWLGVSLAGLISLTSFKMETEEMNPQYLEISTPNEILKKQAFQILESKCNVCHRKQNPFMVFNEKNMTKRAKKIYQMVFVERRMPKGDKIKLSKEEYIQLKNWLASINIY